MGLEGYLQLRIHGPRCGATALFAIRIRQGGRPRRARHLEWIVAGTTNKSHPRPVVLSNQITKYEKIGDSVAEPLPDRFAAICRYLWIRPHYCLGLSSKLDVLDATSGGSQGETNVIAQGYC